MKNKVMLAILVAAAGILAGLLMAAVATGGVF